MKPEGKKGEERPSSSWELWGGRGGPGREAFREMTKGTASHGDLPAPLPYCPLPAPLPAVADSAPWEADAALIMAA